MAGGMTRKRMVARDDRGDVPRSEHHPGRYPPRRCIEDGGAASPLPRISRGEGFFLYSQLSNSIAPSRQVLLDNVVILVLYAKG